MQAALTIVGYAVGSYIGGPFGAQIGAALGSYAGGLLAAPDQQGPRLADASVQLSSYGAAIAKTYGSDRISGVVIWAGPMKRQYALLCVELNSPTRPSV